MFTFPDEDDDEDMNESVRDMKGKSIDQIYPPGKFDSR